MITNEKRRFVYDRIFKFLIDNNINKFPISIEKLCNLLNVELKPLSNIIRETSLKAQDIFDVWGNEDGCVIYYSQANKHKIAYNDYKPTERIRFTICEECSHILLGHTQDPSFNVFLQSYTSDTYEEYDETARIGAGLILCSPKFYYNNQHLVSPTHLRTICQISQPCANTRIKVLNKYKYEIQNHPLYESLPSISVPLSMLKNNHCFDIIKDSSGKTISFRVKKLSEVV